MWVLLIPAVVFATGWLAVQGWRGSNSTMRLTPLFAAGAWLGYFLWEWLVISPGDNIRVDLLLIWPLLGIVSLLGFVHLIALHHENTTS